VATAGSNSGPDVDASEWASGLGSSIGEGEAEDTSKIDSIFKTFIASFSLADDFEEKYRAWKATWFSGASAYKQRYYFDRYPVLA
jgi:hypothetical protein